MPVLGALRINSNPTIPEACAYLEDPANYAGSRIFDIELPIAENKIYDEAHRLAMAGTGALFDVKAKLPLDDELDFNYNEVYAAYQRAAAAGIWLGYKIVSRLSSTEEAVA